MDRPRWLDGESEILALLAALLDKLDRRPAEAWRLPPEVRLDAQKFPRLFRHDADSDRQWALLKSLDGVAITLLAARRRGPFDAEYDRARVQLLPAAEETVRRWLDRPRNVPYATRWREAVADQAHRFADGGAALAARPISLAGKEPGELVAAFARIGEYLSLTPTLRQLSARCFWGHSKFLDNRGDLLASLFPGLRLLPRPVLVNVRVPERFGGVLFIENQDTYVRLVARSSPDVEALALIYASGFLGGAERARAPEGVCLHYHANSAALARDDFEAWWFGRREAPIPLWFWGDLDYAGLSILKVLRARFGDVRTWEPGYLPMLKVLQAGGGHAPATADKAEQTRPGETGCPFADSALLPAVDAFGRFVDQEIV